MKFYHFHNLQSTVVLLCPHDQLKYWFFQFVWISLHSTPTLASPPPPSCIWLTVMVKVWCARLSDNIQLPFHSIFRFMFPSFLAPRLSCFGFFQGVHYGVACAYIRQLTTMTTTTCLATRESPFASLSRLLLAGLVWTRRRCGICGIKNVGLSSPSHGTVAALRVSFHHRISRYSVEVRRTICSWALQRRWLTMVTLDL